MRQVQLRFTPASGHQPLFAPQWRDAVAAAIGQHIDEPGVKGFFHHWAEEAGPRRSQAHDKADICFLASETWVGVTATGADAIDALRHRAVDIMLAASQALGPCAVAQREFRLEAREQTSTLTYSVASLVLPPSVRQPDPPMPVVHAALIRGLNQWAARFGIDLQLGAGDVHIIEMKHLRPMGGTPAPGGRTWARSRVAVVFVSPYRLSGFWTAGGMASKGQSVVKLCGKRTPWQP